MSDALEQIVRNSETGNAVIGALLPIASVGSAVVGSYVGEGTGYLFGHVMDAVPLARDLAPWIGERTGLLSDVANQAAFNVDFYQATGMLAGLIVGAAAPFVLYWMAKID